MSAKYTYGTEYVDPKGGWRWARVDSFSPPVKVPRTLRRAFLVEKNKRYPLHEILAAKHEHRRLKRQNIVSVV